MHLENFLYAWTRSGIPQTPNVPTYEFHGFRRGWFPGSAVGSINVVTRGGQNWVRINPIGFQVDRVGKKFIRTYNPIRSEYRIKKIELNSDGSDSG